MVRNKSSVPGRRISGAKTPTKKTGPPTERRSPRGTESGGSPGARVSPRRTGSGRAGEPAERPGKLCSVQSHDVA